MLKRREFLAMGTAATAGLLFAVPGGRTLAQSRKTVRVAGRPVRVVDVHAHCDFTEVADVIRGTSMADANLSRLLGPERLAEMDAWGIDVAALSINRYWWYAANQPQSREIVRIHDEQLANWCNAHPGRFVALSSPALQFPELAAEQLEYAVRELGHRGGSVGGHVEGESPSSPKYDPFWAKAEELGVPVFMHPQGAPNIIQPNALDGTGGLGNVIGNPLETTLFLSRMIMDGTLDRFPNLKLCAAHGGGFLPSYIGRSDVGCARARGDSSCVNKRPPGDYFKDQILVDSMIFNEEGLRHLVAVGGASQVVYGTDMPHGWPDTLDLIVESPSLTDAEKEAILGGNLVKLLNLG